jgi:opacity protein-like surface antigen
MLRHITSIALLAALAPAAMAADNGFYLGAGATQSDYGLSNPANIDDFDDEDNGFKVIAGFRPLDNFGVELNYIDHGDVTIGSDLICEPEDLCAVTADISSESISGYAVGFLDFPLIDLFAKVGAAGWQFDGQSGPDFDVDENNVDFAWGAGVWAHFGSLGARLEYERFKLVDEDLGTISLSFVYTFL